MFSKEKHKINHWKRIHEREIVIFGCPYGDCGLRVYQSVEVMRHLLSVHSREFPNEGMVWKSRNEGGVPAVAEFTTNLRFRDPKLHRPPFSVDMKLPQNTVGFQEKAQADERLKIWLERQASESAPDRVLRKALQSDVLRNYAGSLELPTGREGLETLRDTCKDLQAMLGRTAWEAAAKLEDRRIQELEKEVQVLREELAQQKAPKPCTLRDVPLTQAVIVYPSLEGNLIYPLNHTDVISLDLQHRRPMDK